MFLVAAGREGDGELHHGMQAGLRLGLEPPRRWDL